MVGYPLKNSEAIYGRVPVKEQWGYILSGTR